MRRTLDPMFRKPSKEHLKWLRAVQASTAGGRTSPLIDFGVTSNRLNILCDMGLVELKGGLYVPTEKGINSLESK